jgi:hypothetical protein
VQPRWTGAEAGTTLPMRRPLDPARRRVQPRWTGAEAGTTLPMRRPLDPARR